MRGDTEYFFVFGLNAGKACNFIKKETVAQVFSYEFGEIFKNIFLQNTSGQLPLGTILTSLLPSVCCFFS